MTTTTDAKDSHITRLRVSESETLTEAAYDALRADIIRGVRPPNERLRIEKMKGLYDVGPTPLREALQRLSADGLVEATGNRGFAVAGLDIEEFEDLNTARTAVEKEALRLSMARGGEEWEAQLVAAAYRMKKADAALAAGDAVDLDAWERANGAFHLATVSACGSRWLLRVRRGLHDQCERYRRTSIYLRRGVRDLGGEHDAIAEAVLARDAETTYRLIGCHFGATASNLSEESEAGTLRTAARG